MSKTVTPIQAIVHAIKYLDDSTVQEIVFRRTGSDFQFLGLFYFSCMRKFNQSNFISSTFTSILKFDYV